MGPGDRLSRLKPVAFYQNNLLLDTLFLPWDSGPLCTHWTQEIEVSESCRPSPTTTSSPCAFAVTCEHCWIGVLRHPKGKEKQMLLWGKPSKREGITVWHCFLVPAAFHTGGLPPHSPVFSFPWATPTQDTPGPPPQTVWCLTHSFSKEAGRVPWARRGKQAPGRP